MSRMQEQIGSSQKRKGIRGNKRILGSEEKGSPGPLISSFGTGERNARVAATRLSRAVTVDNLSIESCIVDYCRMT
jgi:hypothetical protein